MKTLPFILLTSLIALGSVAPAHAGLNIDFSFGGHRHRNYQPVYFRPEPPRIRYYEEAPVVYYRPRPRIVPVYAEPIYYAEPVRYHSYRHGGCD